MRCCYLLPEVQHHQLVEVGDVVQIVAVKNEVLYMRDVIGKEASQPGGHSGRQEGRTATSKLSLNPPERGHSRSWWWLWWSRECLRRECLIWKSSSQTWVWELTGNLRLARGGLWWWQWLCGSLKEHLWNCHTFESSSNMFTWSGLNLKWLHEIWFFDSS